MGNQDASVAADEEPLNVSAETAEVIRWTRGKLTPEQRAWLGALPMTWQGRDYEAVHASLHHPEQWGYVLEPAAAAQPGHSHQPKMFVEGEDHALNITRLESVRPDRKQVVNVGAVGQTRDKDERVCYVV